MTESSRTAAFNLSNGGMGDEPAANGAPGTVITFGPEDHRGYKGADYLVIRHAKGGTTELVGTAPVA